MAISLSDHFTYKRLLRFAIPSIIMMVVTSIYSIVDGIFVSNFVGTTAFSAVNFIFPVILILATLGFMLGTGGSALVSKTLGEGNKDKANQQFSMFVVVSLITGTLLSLLGIILIKPIAILMGAEGQLLQDCITYSRIVLIALPFFMLQLEFQSFFVTAEKPKLGLLVSIACGITNMILDALLVAVFDFGLVGAALATCLSQTLGGVIGLIYFIVSKKSLIKIVKFKFDFRSLGKACVNGSSELMSNVSMNLVALLYNVQLLNMIGENGVSAYGVLMYVCMIFLSIFIGFSIGVAPIIGFNYGANNHDELRNVYRKSFIIIVISSLLMFTISEALARPLSYIFVSYDKELLELTVRAFYIYSFSYLFSGLAIYGSSFFTALNNGLISAIISFLRTLVFQVLAVILLPMVFDVDGIWLSIIADSRGRLSLQLKQQIKI